MTTISFGLAHNDGQGNSTNRVYFINMLIGDEIALTLEPRGWPAHETLYFQGNERITFPNGCSVRYSSMHEWAGNMLWNNYEMTIASGLGFLYLLQQSGDWNVIEGYSELFDKFQGNIEITAADLGADESIKKLYRTPGQYSLFHEFMTNETGELAFYFSTGND